MRNSASFELECPLGSIRMYAIEHDLSASEIRAIFDRGFHECARDDLYRLRIRDLATCNELREIENMPPRFSGEADEAIA